MLLDGLACPSSRLFLGLPLKRRVDRLITQIPNNQELTVGLSIT